MSELSQIYEQVYEKIFRERGNTIFTQQKGVLYSIVLELVNEYDPRTKKPQSQIIFDQVAGIRPSNAIDDDYTVIASLVNAIFIDRQVGAKAFPEPAKTLGNVGVRFHFNRSSRVNQMKWLVFAGCMIVGIYVCVEYIKRQSNNTTQPLKRNSEYREISPPPPPIPAALCLVVPASVASNLPGKIMTEQAIELIDSASYFSCKRSSEADSREISSLKMTTEIIPSDSQREVYVRIKIEDGKPMIDKTTRYELKANLKDFTEYEIVKKACLENLSGLESFVRV